MIKKKLFGYHSKAAVRQMIYKIQIYGIKQWFI